jgi:D-sedoheptulose 7-phosphate isomerase
MTAVDQDRWAETAMRRDRPAAEAVELPREDGDLEHLAGMVVRDYLNDLHESLDRLDQRGLAVLLRQLVTAVESGSRVFIAGNGGSAATASHMCSDLSAVTSGDCAVRGAVFALADNVPRLTSIANDVSYDEVFARQLSAVARAGDVFLAISVSGNSPNLLAAAHVARELGLRVLSLLGQAGRLASLSDHVVLMGAGDYGLSEDLHLAVNHMAVRMLRRTRAFVCMREPESVAG